MLSAYNVSGIPKTWLNPNLSFIIAILFCVNIINALLLVNYFTTTYTILQFSRKKNVQSYPRCIQRGGELEWLLEPPLTPATRVRAPGLAPLPLPVKKKKRKKYPRCISPGSLGMLFHNINASSDSRVIINQQFFCCLNLLMIMWPIYTQLQTSALYVEYKLSQTSETCIRRAIISLT